MQQFVGVQVAFHQRVDAAGMNQRHGRCGSCIRRAGFDDLDAVELAAGLLCRLLDAGAVADQHRLDELLARRLNRSGECVLGLWRDDGGAQRRQAAGALDQLVELPVLLDEQTRHLGVLEADLPQRRQHLGHTFGNRIAAAAGDGRVEQQHVVRQLLAHAHLDGEFVADVGAVQELERLRAIERTRARQRVAECGRNQRSDPHRRRHHLLRRVLVGGARRHVHRIQVARGVREHIEVFRVEDALHGCLVANLDLVVGLVLADHAASPACLRPMSASS